MTNGCDSAMLYRWMIDGNRSSPCNWSRALPGASAGEQYQAGLQPRPFAGPRPARRAPHSRAALEQSYLALLAELDRHFAEHDFLLGGRPSIGDYGLIGPLYAHLYRDPASGRLMREKAPQVAAWVERMIDPPAAGDFLPDDELPLTLLPVLQRMFTEQVPVLQETARQLQQWADANPDTPEIPRAIGSLRYRVGDTQEERLVFPYNLWMWQRALDHYAEMDDQARQTVTALLGEQAAAALATPLPVRVRRENNRLVRG